MNQQHLHCWHSGQQFGPFGDITIPLKRLYVCFGGGFNDLMNKNCEVISCAIALIIKSAVVAARFSGRIRKRSLKRLASMDIHEKDKELLFLKDKCKGRSKIRPLQPGLHSFRARFSWFL